MLTYLPVPPSVSNCVFSVRRITGYKARKYIQSCLTGTELLHGTYCTYLPRLLSTRRCQLSCTSPYHKYLQHTEYFIILCEFSALPTRLVHVLNLAPPPSSSMHRFLLSGSHLSARLPDAQGVVADPPPAVAQRPAGNIRLQISIPQGAVLIWRCLLAASPSGAGSLLLCLLETQLDNLWPYQESRPESQSNSTGAL